MGRICSETWVDHELASVFAFFSDPTNLPRLMPAQMDVRLESLELVPPPEGAIKKIVVKSGENPAAGPGSKILISFRVVPFLTFRGRWLAEILEYEPLSYFLDTQRKGPMKSWRHRHSFCAETRGGVAGTIVRDEVEYQLPFGILGRLADSLFVERMMRRTFASRHQQLHRLLR